MLAMSTSATDTGAMAAWDSYQRMRVRLAARLNRDLARRTGLSEPDFEVLQAIAESSADSVRARELRCCLEWEKSRLSHQIRRMEQRGLVVRSECAEDNRGSVVELTTAGRSIVREAGRVHEEAVRRHVLDRLTPEQTRGLGEISDLILAGLVESTSP